MGVTHGEQNEIHNGSQLDGIMGEGGNGSDPKSQNELSPQSVASTEVPSVNEEVQRSSNEAGVGSNGLKQMQNGAVE